MKPSIEGTRAGLLAVIGDADEQKILVAIERYFGLLERTPALAAGEMRHLPVLLGPLSSRLAAIRPVLAIVVDFEEAHALFWRRLSKFISITQVPRFQGERLEQACERLMIRTVHFMQNRRLGPFEDLAGFLGKLVSLHKQPPGGRLEHFLGLLPRLVPSGDPGGWLKCLPASTAARPVALEELGPLSLECRQAVAEYLEKERLASALMRALSGSKAWEQMRACSQEFIQAMTRELATSDPFVCTHGFLVTGLVPPGAGLELPALVIGYLEKGRNRSNALGLLRGRNLALYLTGQGEERQLYVSNLSTGDELAGIQLELGEELLSQVQAGLAASGGRYLMALVRVNEPTVRMIWVGSGSIELSGRFGEAMAAMNRGDRDRSAAILRELIATQPELGETHYQLALLERAANTPEAFETARKLLLRELEVDPGSSRALASLAVTAKREGDLVEARRLLELSLKRNPHSIDALLSYASTLVSHDILESAEQVIAAVARALNIDPGHEGAANFMAAIERDYRINLERAVRLEELDTSIH